MKLLRCYRFGGRHSVVVLPPSRAVTPDELLFCMPVERLARSLLSCCFGSDASGPDPGFAVKVQGYLAFLTFLVRVQPEVLAAAYLPMQLRRPLALLGLGDRLLPHCKVRTISTLCHTLLSRLRVQYTGYAASEFL